MNKPNMTTSRRLLTYLTPYRKQFTAGLLATLAVNSLNLLLVKLFSKELIGRILINKETHYLSYLIIGLLLLYSVKGLFSFTFNYLMSFVGNRVVTNLRYEIYQHLQRLSLRYHETHRTGESISRITHDVGFIQSSVSITLAELLSQGTLLIGAMLMIFITHWRLALLTLVVFPFGAYMISKIGARVRHINRRVQERIANLTSVLQESISGIRIVKAFNMEEHEARRFSSENEASLSATMRSVKAVSVLTPLVELLFAMVGAFIIWYGGREVLSGNLEVEDFFAFFAYVIMASTPLTMITHIYSRLQQALAAADRVFELLDTPIELRDLPDALELTEIDGSIGFEDVSFGYREDLEVLQDINLQVKPGEIVALVGPSGAGKTSLVNLIPRFYDPTSGRITVDGYDLRQVKIESLRRQIGLVPQESILFGVSVAENILYGKPGSSQEEIERAAKAANAHDFIMSLPEGYETLVGERGVSLSGGQRQRISIARAVLSNPKILILDEATSALDTESERLVQEALERLMKERTTFVIAHRLSTIKFAHRIVVLNNGAIEEEGDHKELMAKNGLYRRLYETGMMNQK